MIYELKDTSKVKELFTGAVDSLVTTCLEGMMDSKIYVTDLDDPRSAMAYLAEFAFFAGEPDRELASFKPKGVVGMVPYSEAWAKLIEECQPNADKVTRYAIQKGAKFDRANLQRLVDALPEGYEIKRIDGELYDKCLEIDDFEDGVCHFASKEEYLRLGRVRGEIVAEPPEQAQHPLRIHLVLGAAKADDAHLHKLTCPRFHRPRGRRRPRSRPPPRSCRSRRRRWPPTGTA